MGEPIDPDEPIWPGEPCPECWSPGGVWEDQVTPSAVLIKLTLDSLPTGVPNPPDEILLPQTQPRVWELPKPDKAGWYGWWMPSEADGDLSYISVSYLDDENNSILCYYEEAPKCTAFYEDNFRAYGGTVRVTFTDVMKAIYMFCIITVRGHGVFERYLLADAGWWFRAVNLGDNTVVHIQLQLVYDQPYRKHITGTLTPDAADDFHVISLYNGQCFYKNFALTFWIWWDGVSTWYISDKLGDITNPHWKRDNNNPVGVYAPRGGADGVATINRGWT